MGEYDFPQLNSSTINARETHPRSLRERDEILRALSDIVASHHFSSSKRYPALLQYVVENTLAGKTDLLKERTIGVEVFNRPPTYDTNADTVVRFTAGEVRKRLAAYYHEDGRNSGLRITLPSGSYIPEFIFEPEQEDNDSSVSSGLKGLGGLAAVEASHNSHIEGVTNEIMTPSPYGMVPVAASSPGARRSKRFILFASIGLMLLALGGWKIWAGHRESSLDTFWRPLVRDRGTILVCAGGNVFAKNPVPGAISAGKNEFPYFSLQTATSVTLLSSFIERMGATPRFDFAGSTPWPELHSQPVILLNAYNNRWTLRLVEPLRFHFSPNADLDQSIVDRTRPEVRWARDLSAPYSNADDYALVARFWDTSTDNWVLALAGLGRNGTEAASEFVTSTRSMQLLRDQVPGDFSSRNVEVVLKVSVIDGKTGPPSIIAVQTW